MGYKTFVSINIAVVGVSETAQVYAARYALAGNEVFLAWKSGQRCKAMPAVKSFDNIHVCDIETAAAEADVIVIVAPPEDVREIAYWLGDVRGKVIIDDTANFASSAGETINTVNAISAITGSQSIIKVFCTRGYEHILEPLIHRHDVQWILVGDSKKAKEATKILARDLGVKGFIDFGGSEALPQFDAMTRCWCDIAMNKVGKNLRLTH